MSVNAATRRLTGGQAVVECIQRHGVRHVFNVPGESYLGALDAFFDFPEIQLITNRHEGGACYMAEAYGKATRTPGVCFVTRGPGATHASIGVHCAAQDSTPLVLFVGQVPRVNRGREAFQELDYRRFFGDIAKWVIEIDRPDKVPEVVNRAFHVARSGRPGPVVVSLPEDMLVEQADMYIPDPIPVALPHPDPALVREMVARINAAAHPVLLVGAGVQYSGAREALIRFAERFQVPVLTSWRRNDAFPNGHAHYGGNLAIGASPAQELARGADLLVVVGDRMTEITTGDYALPLPGQPVIQVDADPAVIGRTFAPELALVADARRALETALEQAAPAANGERAGWIAEAHQRYVAFAEPRERPAKHVSAERVVRELQATLPVDAILTTDAGNFSAWVQRYYRYDAAESFLGPIVGSMGYSIPAAIAAKLAHPERVVVGTCGDGGFLMNAHELATAVQYGVNIIQLIFNNSSLGAIRMHQERNYPQRTIATELRNPDFAALARAYGAEGYTVRSSDEFLPALQAALKAGKPAVLDLVTDVENLSVGATLSEIRARTAAKRGG